MKQKAKRSGKVLRTLFFFLIILIVMGVAGYAGWQRLQVTVQADPPQQVQAKRETFIHEILERGSVDSASNVEIRCQVESAGGLTIISVVPEGTVVKKGDLLVELDSSTLRENVTKQRITVLSSQAALAQSKANLKTSELTLREYLEGKYEEEKKQIENELFEAEESVRTQEDNLFYYKRLLERGYVTDSKVEADLIELEKAKKKYEIATLKLKVLNEYTREKNVVQYTADIATREARVKADLESLQLDMDRLTHLETQLARCHILAPQDGQVVYYMPRWGGDEDIIKEGKKVVERQVLLRLPDPTQMQVKGLVNEANIRLVKIGQKATIRLEAFPNQIFNGDVRLVNDYPEPSYSGGSMSKEYMTTIMVFDPPEGIKPGLTAEAKIQVNEIRDALVVPIQAVFEYGGKTYSVKYENGTWSKIEVKIGPTNDKAVVILEGLKEGDSIVLGAWSHRDKVDLPKLQQGENGEGKEGVKGELESKGDSSGGSPGPAGGSDASAPSEGRSRREGGPRPEGGQRRETGPRGEGGQQPNTGQERQDSPKTEIPQSSEQKTGDSGNKQTELRETETPPPSSLAPQL